MEIQVPSAKNEKGIPSINFSKKANFELSRHMRDTSVILRTVQMNINFDLTILELSGTHLHCEHCSCAASSVCLSLNTFYFYTCVRFGLWNSFCILEKGIYNRIHSETNNLQVISEWILVSSMKTKQASGHPISSWRIDLNPLTLLLTLLEVKELNFWIDFYRSTEQKCSHLQSFMQFALQNSCKSLTFVVWEK